MSIVTDLRGQRTADSGGPSPFLELRGVTLARGGKPVLAGIDLALEEERIAIIGRNGSGKSSLVRLFNGLLLPDEGIVSVFGRGTSDARAELPRDVGFVFQNPDHQAIFPTVDEELAFGLTQLGVDRRTARSDAAAFLAENGCTHLSGQPFLELSEGQKQLVCILAVLIMRPRLLVLDEPFSSLDHVTRRLLMRRLEGIDQKIVMVSHELDLITEFDRVIWLEAGIIQGDGVPKDIVPAYLEAAEALARGSGRGLL